MSSWNIPKHVCKAISSLINNNLKILYPKNRLKPTPPEKNTPSKKEFSCHLLQKPRRNTGNKKFSRDSRDIPQYLKWCNWTKNSPPCRHRENEQKKGRFDHLWPKLKRVFINPGLCETAAKNTLPAPSQKWDFRIKTSHHREHIRKPSHHRGTKGNLLHSPLATYIPPCFIEKAREREVGRNRRANSSIREKVSTGSQNARFRAWWMDERDH